MTRKITYWVATGIVAASAALAGFSYLMAGPEVIEGFKHVGYPQHLRVILGIAKLLGAVALVVPRFPTLKEWAYAGFTFTWISATVAHYLVKDSPEAYLPLALLIVLFISYATRPPSRR